VKLAGALLAGLKRSVHRNVLHVLSHVNFLVRFKNFNVAFLDKGGRIFEE